jgi:hypothetical protein
VKGVIVLVLRAANEIEVTKKDPKGDHLSMRVGRARLGTLAY